MREQLSLNSIAGLPTFSGRPFLTDPEQLDEWQPDVAIVGAPFDVSTTNRPGARFGPRAAHPGLLPERPSPRPRHRDLRLDRRRRLRRRVVPPRPDRTLAREHPRPGVRGGSAGIAPVIIGGDHSITWPAQPPSPTITVGNVGIVHFDAHADTADILEGNLASHGTPMRRLIESGGAGTALRAGRAAGLLASA
jgi:agmatinase